MHAFYRFGLTWLAVLATFSATAQATAGTWAWATTPLGTADDHYSQAQVLDEARRRLYVLTEARAPQQVGGVQLPAGATLHTFDPTTGQWLAAEPIGPAFCLKSPRLTLDPATGDVLLVGHLTRPLLLGADSVGTNAQDYRPQALVARYRTATRQWLWARQATADAAGYEAAELLPSGDVLVSGSFTGARVAVDSHTLARTLSTGRHWTLCAGFVGRLDGATGRCQWLTLVGGRAFSSQPGFDGQTPSGLFKLALDQPAGQALLYGESDTAAVFGTQVVPAGAYLARLNAATGQWVGATAISARISVLTADSAGTVYLGGTTNDALLGYNALYVARLGAQDQPAWEYRRANPYRYVNGFMWRQPSGLAPDRHGNLFVSNTPIVYIPCATDFVPLPVIDTNLLSLNLATGAVRWDLHNSGTGDSAPCAVSADGLGGAYLTGFYVGEPQFGASVLPASPRHVQLYLAHVAPPLIVGPRLAGWPNPARQRVWLTAPTGAVAAVVDGCGRTVRTAALKVAGELDLTGLVPGFYVVRVGGATTRLVVE